MKYAAVTFVYNETVNLPIWTKYYGELFGRQNLFVLDRSSTDGSTEDLGLINVIKLDHSAFDEDSKTHLMSMFHSALTAVFDAVIVTDCDEILVPDPDYFPNLCAYIESMEQDYVNAMGVDIIHMITEEAPIDLSRPILSQRQFGRFHAPECKNLLSRVPVRWLPGLHSSNLAPKFDPRLINFHLKFMDYGSAVKRQDINLKTQWSEQSLRANYGAHHRQPLSQFVHEGFLGAIDLRKRNLIGKFEFGEEIADLEARTAIDPMGNYRVPMDISKMVMIPERFKLAV